jgi:hypothetical protein
MTIGFCILGCAFVAACILNTVYNVARYFDQKELNKAATEGWRAIAEKEKRATEIEESVSLENRKKWFKRQTEK